MQFKHVIDLAAPVDEVFTLVSTLERIAQCLPGIRIVDGSDNACTGDVTVAVGPMVAQYRGTATLIECDEAARRVVIRANGKDTGGRGSVDVTFSATVVPMGPGESTVHLVTDLRLRGLAAQLGGSVIHGVADTLIQEIVANVGSSKASRVADGVAAAPRVESAVAAMSRTSGAEPDATFDRLSIVRGQAVTWVTANQKPLLVGAVLGAFVAAQVIVRRPRRLADL